METALALRLEALVLAAGSSVRFGGGKLRAPWRGAALLGGALSAAFASPARQIHLVWGGDPAVVETATDCAKRAGEEHRLRLVHAECHLDGLSASLAAGIAALPEDAEGVFVFLGDMPRVPPEIWMDMAEALEAGALAVAPRFDGRRGHPVLFGRLLWSYLLALTGDKGAGALLRSLGDRLALVDAPHDGVLFDVDRREDLA